MPWQTVYFLAVAFLRVTGFFFFLGVALAPDIFFLATAGFFLAPATFFLVTATLFFLVGNFFAAFLMTVFLPVGRPRLATFFLVAVFLRATTVFLRATTLRLVATFFLVTFFLLAVFLATDFFFPTVFFLVTALSGVFFLTKVSSSKILINPRRETKTNARNEILPHYLLSLKIFLTANNYR